MTGLINENYLTMLFMAGFGKYLIRLLPVIITIDCVAQTDIEPQCTIETNIVVNNVSCGGGNDGSIDLTIRNAGTPEFLWSNGEKTEDIYMLRAGNYSVTLTDGTFSKTLTVDLTEPPALMVDLVSVKDVSCSGGNDGSFKLEVKDGTEPYTFRIGEETFPGGIFENMKSGDYEIIVSDRKNCTAQSGVSISEPEQDVIFLGGDLSVFSGEKIEFDAGAGYSNYRWNTGDTERILVFSREVTSLTQETISVEASDANGCHVFSNAVTITVQPETSVEGIQIE